MKNILIKNLLMCCSFALCLNFVNLKESKAISIDSFAKDQSSVSDIPGAPSTVSANYTEATLSTIIGKNRTLESSVISGAAGQVRSETSFGFYRFSNDSGIRGNGNIIWDGDSNTSLNTAGLGGINFFQDNSNAIIVRVSSFDYAFNRPVSIVVTVYNATNNSSVSGTLVLNSQVNSATDLKYYFRNFPGASATETLFSGTGDVNQIFNTDGVGAITLSVVLDPLATDSDLTLDFVNTDGDCDLVPNTDKLVKDVCNKCGGTTKAGDILTDCTDCLGVPYPAGFPLAAALPTESCTTNQPGVCTNGTYTSTGPGNCSCQAITGPSNEICDELDNDCDGQIDETFPTKNTTCSIGTTPCIENGQIVCTVSGGITCNASAPNVLACENSRGCDGVPNSGLVRDICGICGGNGTSCLGCDGQPNSGLVKDVCNVCGGNGTSCLDCKGVPNGTSKLDKCNVCDGDGKSCLPCATTNQSPVFTLMDGLAKQQEVAIRKILRELEKVNGNKKYIVDTRNKAHELQLANWILSWTTMPIQNTQCQTNQFTVQYCVTSDFTSTIATYNGRAAELFQLGQQALNALKKKKGKKFTKADAKLINKVNSTYKDALKASDRAPKNHATCS